MTGLFLCLQIIFKFMQRYKSMPYLLSLFFLAISCVSNTKPASSKASEAGNAVQQDVNEPSTKPDSGVSYNSVRAEIERQRADLFSLYKSGKLSVDSASKIFTSNLVNKIFPYWYGTLWDFNGFTDTPQQGQIACGYLVSTTLKHAGIRVNRYKMAQKSAMDGALMLEPRNELIVRRTFRDSFISYFKRTAEDGLYMLGLSNHVGYLYKSGSEAYFIHSTYVFPSMVICEKAMDSPAMSSSTIFVLADITHNRKLILKWLKGEVLPH